MKKIIFGAMAAAALLACSKEQVIEQNRANDEISFSVVTDNQTKAAAIYSASEFMQNFTVSAYYANGDAQSWYFKDEVVNKVTTDGSTTWNSDVTHYWPKEGTLDFFAVVNADMSYYLENTTQIHFNVEDKVTDQKDILYAINKGQTKENGPVELNFKHALSQIVFKAKNSNSTLSVEITGVKVGQVKNTGIVYLHNSVNPDKAPSVSNNYNTLKDYTVTFDAVNVDESTPVELTTDTENAMLLLPQTTTAWTPTEATFDGSYLAVNCTIYNVEGTNKVVLHEGWAVIPVAFTWEQGKQYIYTFVFGAGNGGYNGGEEDEPTPSDDPVLTPITYTVTVDDFTPVTPDYNVDMKF